MGFASVNGLTLHYRLSGARDALPLVLINSLGTNFHIWDEVVPLLGEDTRVLCYDTRGHGLSDGPPGPYGIDDHVADLIGLADALGFSRFDLCGISIGGMIAIRATSAHPERVRRLMLCDTGIAIGTKQSWNDRIAKVEQGQLPQIAEALAAGWFTRGFREMRAAEFSGWRNMLARCPPDAYAANCAGVRDADLVADAAAIAAPTLVVAGEEDASTPPAMARDLASRIAGAEVRIVGHAAHVPAIEQPAALAALIREHLSEVVHV